MTEISNAFTLFMSLLVEAIPFLLLGVLFSSLLMFIVDEGKLLSLIPNNPLLGALMGSCVGFLFPVCECGNVPVARRLLVQGTPAPVAIAFLLSAPTINPVVIWSTWTAFRDQPEIVVWRILFSLILATVIGAVFGVQSNIKSLLQTSVSRLIPNPEPNEAKVPSNKNLVTVGSSDKPSLLQSGTYWLGKAGDKSIRLEGSILQNSLNDRVVPLPKEKRWGMVLDNIIFELRELGGILILGSAIAAIIQVFAPRDLILSLGQDTVTSILAMMVLAALVSICSTVDSFFALSFSSTFSTGSLIAFLVFGPIIDIKAIGLMLSVFKARVVIYFFVLAAQLVFILTLSYSFFA